MKQIRSIAVGLVSTWLGLLSSPAAFAEHTTVGRPRASAPVCVCPQTTEEEEVPGKVPEKVPSKTPSKVPTKVPEKVPEKVPSKIPYKIPVECLEPAKVLSETCHNVPIDVCLNYFKDRVAENKLKPTTDDASEAVGTFCLKQFREQLFKD